MATFLRRTANQQDARSSAGPGRGYRICGKNQAIKKNTDTISRHTMNSIVKAIHSSRIGRLRYGSCRNAHKGLNHPWPLIAVWHFGLYPSESRPLGDRLGCDLDSSQQSQRIPVLLHVIACILPNRSVPLGLNKPKFANLSCAGEYIFRYTDGNLPTTNGKSRSITFDIEVPYS
jgi:hypothetical protein